MCYFITIGVPNRHAVAMQDSVPRGMALDAVDNRSIRRWMPENFEMFLLTSGMCSCDLYQPKRERRHADPDRMREKYRKLGWSINKIDRAVTQSLASVKKIQDFTGLRPDVVSLISAMACSTKRVAVLVHFYNEDVTDGVIEIRGRTAKSLAQFESDASLDEDIVLIVKAD